MKFNDYLVLMCLSVTATCLGCGDLEPDSETRKSELTFNDNPYGTGELGRAVHHDRWYRNRSYSRYSENYPRGGQQDYQLAATVRSAGLVTTIGGLHRDTCLASGLTPCANTSECSENQVCHLSKCKTAYRGSSTLVGDNTLLTAYHVMDGIVSTSVHGVSFDGARSSAPGYSGSWVVDDPEVDQPFELTVDGYAWFQDALEGTQTFSYSKPQESVGLPERLFQISMHGAEPNGAFDFVSRIDESYGVRQALRNSWGIKMITDEALPNAGHDAALLEGTGLDAGRFEGIANYSKHATFEGLGFGEFEINFPGVLFNQLHLDDTPDRRPQLAWMTHFTPYPQDKAEDPSSPLVSHSGLLAEATHSFPRDYCGILGGSPFATTLNLQLAAMSARGGSSGGAFLTCPTEDCFGYTGDDTWEDEGRFPQLEVVGVLSLGSPNAPKDRWSAPEYFDSNPTSGHYVALSGVPNRTEMHTFSSLETTVLRCEKACTANSDCSSGTCEDGMCNGCYQQLPQCKTTSEDCSTGTCHVYCAKWDVETPFSETGVGPPNVTYSAASTPGGSTTADKDTMALVDCDRTLSNLPNKISIGVGESSVPMSPGLVVGIRGYEHESGGIGNLRPVCAVWDRRNYTDNWRWLRTHGPRSIGSVAPVMVYSSFLKRALLTEHLIDHQAKTVRPTPMKLCPPNHFLSGFNFRRNASYIEAIESLQCTPISSLGLDMFESPLLAPDYDYQIGKKAGLYDYSLTQRIGVPTGVPNDDVSCGNLVAAGVYIQFKSGKLVDLGLKCTIGP